MAINVIYNVAVDAILDFMGSHASETSSGTSLSVSVSNLV